MNLGKLIIRLSVAAALLSLAPCIYADSIVITSGVIQYSSSGTSSFSLAGSGFSTTGLTSPLQFVSLNAVGPIGFGATRTTGGSVDSQDGEIVPLSPITVGGSAFSPTSALLILRFSSQSFVAPLQPSAGFVVVAPFTITSGLIEGYPGFTLGDGVPLFSDTLTGSGVTILSFVLAPNGLFQLESQTFVFGQTVSGVTVQSVPEPASMLLFGSSLAGLLGIRRKRSKNGNDRH